jgi:MATE family multidrug resistance protein
VVLAQGLIMALLFATLFLLLHRPLSHFILDLSHASNEVKLHADTYFTIRAWSAPAALANYVVLGWLLGTQNAKAPMWIVILSNVTNIALDLLFVVGFDWKVEGAALASVIADYSGLVLGLFFVKRAWVSLRLPRLSVFIQSTFLQLSNGLGNFVRLNRDIFLRSLCLQAAFSFMTFQGASYGDDTVAANAVLMSFLMIISYGMDGFAYAIEALVGKAIGAKDREELKESIAATFFWSFTICVVLTLVFYIYGFTLISIITDIESVAELAKIYLPWLIAMPLSAMWCFILDGIFIGATKGKEMRNGMFLATCTFFLVFVFMEDYGNHALWAAMISFMLMRGVSLALVFIRQWNSHSFL